MKKGRKLPVVVSGILVAALVSYTALPALASTVAQNITVHTGVKVYVDDAQIDAGDTNGNPDAFIYNGTTYVAVAAVSKSLGENVVWDGNTSSVYIGNHANSSSYLLSVCPPYMTAGVWETSATVDMCGVKYANCITVDGPDGGYGYFNLNGQYDTLSFDIGHRDDAWNLNDSVYYIYLDNELAFSVDLTGDMLPQHYEVPLNGALQMMITSGGWGRNYAMANIRIS